MQTLADFIIQALQAAGTRRLFGMPGGGSNADLIEAAGRNGLPFTLAHTETAAAFMASAQAELTGAPGACLATLGPGAASVVNGVANALLDRIPLLVFTDCYSESAAQIMQHQTLSQTALFAPVTKWSAHLRAAELAPMLQRALREANGSPPGPVHLDCAVEVTDAKWDATPEDAHTTPDHVAVTNQAFPIEIERLLRRARRPMFLLGLGARTTAVAAAVCRLCEHHGIPALVTYKAKGVVPDHHEWFGGVLTHGALERPMLEQADLFIAVGLDPVELLAKRWTYPQPIISLSAWHFVQKHLPFAAEWVGDVAQGLQQVSACLSAFSAWDVEEVRQTVEAQRAAMRVRGEAGKLWPYRVVECVAEAYPMARVTVDAGAHMFPTMALWPAQRPHDLLISNGLATMGFALPAAIGAALFDASTPTVALTGDGGLLMCLAELRTAARANLPLRIVVFDDSALSLIKIKQVQRGYRTDGVSLDGVHWVAVGEGLGVPSFQASDERTLERCLSDLQHHAGPALIAATVDPQPYQATIKALRG